MIASSGVPKIPSNDVIDGQLSKLKRKYLLQAFKRVCLQNAAERVFSVHVDRSAVRTFHSMLGQDCSTDRSSWEEEFWTSGMVRICKIDRPPIAAEVPDKVAALLADTMFFQVVSSAPSSIKRPSSSRPDGLQVTDLAISLLKLMRVDLDAQVCVVNSEPFKMTSDGQLEAKPLCFSLSAMSLSALAQMHAWRIQTKLFYRFLDVIGLEDVDASLQDSSELQDLLGDLLRSEGFAFDENHEHARQREYLLHHMQQHGLVEEGRGGGPSGRWHLTQLGIRSLEVGTEIANPEPALQVRDVPPEEMEIIELMLSLERGGWSHISVLTKLEAKEIQKAPYVAGDSKQVWYSYASDDNLNRDYLILLVTASDHGKPVPHLQKAAHYAMMMGKKVTSSGQRRRSVCARTDEDEWFDEALLKPLPRAKWRRGLLNRFGKAVAAKDAEGELLVDGLDGTCDSEDDEQGDADAESNEESDKGDQTPI